VYCQISGYGPTGPMGGAPGYDLALQAFGGLMSVTGQADRPPLRVGVPIVDITAAHLAFEGVLLALRERAETGSGQFIDISLLDAVLSILHPHSATWAETGVNPLRTGDGHPSVVPYQVFEAAEGELVFVGAASDVQFGKLVRILGRPELADDPLFARNRDRVTNRDKLQDELAPLFISWRPDQLAALLRGEGLVASVVNSVGDALTSEATRARAMFVESESYRGVGIAVKMHASGASGISPPVDIGADTDRVLSDLGYSPDRVDTLRQAGVFG
jgi:crotonobetainyl-CoA:carnitine CoA-transferase CaiB-like acyl-CoA transferase